MTEQAAAAERRARGATPRGGDRRRVRRAERRPRAGHADVDVTRGGPDEPPPVPAAALPGGRRDPAARADRARPAAASSRSRRNARALLAEVTNIDLAKREVAHRGARRPDARRCRYDTLVVAAGATHSYFGRDEFAEFAPGMKTIEDARYLRDRILLGVRDGRALHRPGGAGRAG